MTPGLPQPSCKHVTENEKCWQRDVNVETKANNSYHFVDSCLVLHKPVTR